MAEEKQKEVQEKVLVYQILQNQLEEFTKQATVLETRLNELELTGNSLSEIDKATNDSETLFSLGSGCYGHGKLLDKQKFMIEVGAGIMANKSLPEAKALIEERKKEIAMVSEKLQKEMENIAASMNKIGADLQKLNEDKKPEEKDKGVYVG